MSILLDSLRKSEAQRKIGDAPSIYSSEETGTQGPPRSGWLAWVLMGVTAAAIVWFGWRQYADPDTAGAHPQQTTAQSTTGESGTAPPGASPSTNMTSDEGESRTPVERLAQNNEPAKPAETNPSEAAGSPVDRIAAFVADDEGEPLLIVEDQTPSVPDGSPELREALVEDETIEAETIDDLGSMDDLLADINTAEDPAPPSRSRVDPPDLGPLNYWQLPISLRDEMPEFKISVLVYAQVPEDRFLLMNGERLQEQAEYEGITLDEIRRDGAVFIYGSYRFLVKR